MILICSKNRPSFNRPHHRVLFLAALAGYRKMYGAKLYTFFYGPIEKCMGRKLHTFFYGAIEKCTGGLQLIKGKAAARAYVWAHICAYSLQTTNSHIISLTLATLIDFWLLALAYLVPNREGAPQSGSLKFAEFRRGLSFPRNMIITTTLNSRISSGLPRSRHSHRFVCSRSLAYLVPNRGKPQSGSLKFAEFRSGRSFSRQRDYTTAPTTTTSHISLTIATPLSKVALVFAPMGHILSSPLGRRKPQFGRRRV